MPEAQVVDITSRVIIALIGIGVFFLILSWLKSRFDIEKANRWLYISAVVFLVVGSIIMGIPTFPVGLYLLLAAVLVLSILYLVIMTKVVGHVEDEYPEDYKEITGSMPSWLVVSTAVGLVQILKIKNRDRFLRKSLNMALVVAVLVLVSLGLLAFYMIHYGLIGFNL